MNATEEAARKREFWDAPWGTFPTCRPGDPAMLPCVTRIASAPLGNPFGVAEVRETPDLAWFDWPAVRCAGLSYHELTDAARQQRAASEETIATAALLLSRHLTGRPATRRDHAADSLTQVSPLALH